ncbi:hypothetical protein BDP27DRAFT_992267 [Rhodocollybia butyracea]|uniref:F-box domain-containing protein n=1 Tax=Rhodocollybia butyracea TaxID=206335 RepID=A0A9P5U4E9_9AGAR|nr:hypothetical protein BDP27DRAFT_992267 [Rhodocollybia butyracea]
MTFEISLDSLPLELLENIISFVPDDKTLASCAQVCRRWVPASRTTLFRSLSLPNDLRTRSFLNLLDNDTQSTLTNARIKHLNLSSSSRSGVGSDSERVITSWASRTPKTRAALHAVFGQLDSFCPALKSLEMSSIEVTLVEQETEPKSSYIPSRLESLSISYILDPATLALVAPFCSSLRKFEYDWHTQQYSSARSLPGVGAILRAAEDTLEELSLKTGSWAEGVSFDEAPRNCPITRSTPSSTRYQHHISSPCFPSTRDCL